MVDGRTNLAKDISQLIRKTYGSNIKVFKTEIPLSVKAAETSAVGKSIYSYDKNGKVVDVYKHGLPKNKIFLGRGGIAE